MADALREAVSPGLRAERAWDLMKLIVGMSGATGAVLGVRLLQQLQLRPEVETHLVLSR